jgi:uncharacterized OsmC-like protein
MGKKQINGVPVATVQGVVDAVKTDPANGKTKWSATTTWKGGFDCESKVRDHTIVMSEPDGLGGSDAGPNMVETVLAAYGSCLMVGYTLNASLRGVKIKDLKIEVEGDLDLAGFFGLSDKVPAGFSGVRAKVHLDADASPKDVQSLHDHVLKTSPVGCILTKPLAVTTELVAPAPAPAAAPQKRPSARRAAPARRSAPAKPASAASRGARSTARAARQRRA